MFKKATTTINKNFAALFLAILSSNSFAAWDDLNMTEGVTAISKECLVFICSFSGYA